MRWPSTRVCALLLLLSGCRARAPHADSSPHADSLFVSCEDAGRIGVIDMSTDSLVATWPAGKRPRGLSLSPDARHLYVALSGSPKGGPGVDERTLPPPDRRADGIGEFEVSSGRLLRILTTGQDPEAFDVSADGRAIFVSNEETAQASFVDVASGSVRRVVPVGAEPEGVRLRPDGRIVYVTSERDDAVFALDASTGALIARISTPGRPRAVVFSTDGARAYVSCETGGSVSVIDSEHHVVLATIAIPSGTGPARPMGLVLSESGGSLFVSSGRGGSVAIIDTGLLQVTRTIPNVGPRPWGIALSPDGRKLYTANGPSSDVSVIDIASGNVLKLIPVCRGTWGLATRPRPAPVH